MSRQRKSKFNAISAEHGNELRGKAIGMMDAAVSSRRNASEAQQSIEERRGAVAGQRNEQAAQEGLRQRDIRASHPTPFRPHRDTGMRDAPAAPGGGGDGLYNGLVQKVAARRKPDQRRSLFSTRR